jgi:hypothetical protein
MTSPDHGTPSDQELLSAARDYMDLTDLRAIPIEEFVAAAAVVKVLGTMSDAYLSRLGEMLADSTPAILRRIRLSRYPPTSTGRLAIKIGRSKVVFAFDGDLSDDAKIALIDFDLTDRHLSGAVFRWDEANGEWRRA